MSRLKKRSKFLGPFLNTVNASTTQSTTFSQKWSICANWRNTKTATTGLSVSFWVFFLQNVTAHFGLAWPNSPASKRDPSKHHARSHVVYSYCSVFFFVFAQNSTSNWTSLFVFLLNEAKLPCCSVCMDSWLIILYDFCTFALLWQVTGLYFWWLLFSCFVLFLVFFGAEKVKLQSVRKTEGAIILLQEYDVVFCSCFL